MNFTKAEQLKCCRSKVVEMRSRGLSQVEIAHELQVSKASISLDMQYLHNHAKESLKNMLQRAVSNMSYSVRYHTQTRI